MFFGEDYSVTDSIFDGRITYVGMLSGIAE